MNAATDARKVVASDAGVGKRGGEVRSTFCDYKRGISPGGEGRLPARVDISTFRGRDGDM